MFGGLMDQSVAPIVCAAALLALPGSALATGGVWCHHDDANMTFDFKAVMSRDGTGNWFDIGGTLTTKFGALPTHLASFDIGDRNLTQRWIGREGILLQVQKYEAEPNAAVMLTVVTRSVDEGPYEGTYELRVTAENGDEAFLVKQGKISCDAD